MSARSVALDRLMRRVRDSRMSVEPQVGIAPQHEHFAGAGDARARALRVAFRRLKVEIEIAVATFGDRP